MNKLLALIGLLALPAASVFAADDVPPIATVSAVDSINKVSINKATAELLAERLNGVGITKAQAIVSYRDNHGPFQSIEQLSEVKGIGPAIVEKNRDYLSL